jgi:hypothetical protein
MLDMECGGEWNDGVWEAAVQDDGRLVVTSSPPPRDCREGFDIPRTCGHVDYLIAATIPLREGRYLALLLGHKKRRLASDLPLLKAVVESAQLRSKRLPPRS